MTAPRELVVELRRHRRAARIRQADLARRIGIGSGTLGRWERRKADPGLGGFCAWCKELAFDIVLPAQRAEGELLISNQKSGQKIGQPQQAVARRRAARA